MIQIPRERAVELMSSPIWITIVIEPPYLHGKYMGQDYFCDNFTSEFRKRMIEESFTRIKEVFSFYDKPWWKRVLRL